MAKQDAKNHSAIKKLIRETIDAAGPIDPAAVPHTLKERIRAQVSGDIDIDDYVAEVLRETGRQG
ncbi:MAG: hypothetical protein AAGA09_05895 [Pseudomonadota bacterium]